MLSIIGGTHPGRREHNEDCFTADSHQGLALVADGMGGYACGEIASDLVKSTIESAIADGHSLELAIEHAHDAVIHAAGAVSGRRGMGSTVVAMKSDGFAYQIAWVGDSRAYLWDGVGALKQITRDHSFVEQLLASGSITYQDAVNHPNRNLITQAVGVDAQGGLEIGFVNGRLSSGQAIVLCSDGLVDEVLDEDILRLLQQSQNADEALQQLLSAALSAGGRDNITIVIASAKPVDGVREQPAIEPDIVRETTVGETTVRETATAETGLAAQGETRGASEGAAPQLPNNYKYVAYAGTIVLALLVLLAIVFGR